jgi:class 3 adenylate cyclase
VGSAYQRLGTLGRLVTYDKRGTGISDSVDPGAFPTLEERVDELVAVLDAVGFNCPTVLAGADGAAIAMMFAATYPHRTHALCLWAPLARGLKADDYPLGYTPDEAEVVIAFARDTWGTGESVHLNAPSKADDPVFVEWYAQFERRSMSPSGFKRFASMVLQIDVRSLLPTIRVPTVIVQRSGNQIVLPELSRYVADHIPNARYIEVDGSDNFWVAGDTEPLLSAMEELVTGSAHVAAPERVLATIMFTDIISSTEQAASLGDRRWLELLAAHDRVIRRGLQRFGGREIKSTGDGFLATFDGPGRAIRCACNIRDGLRPFGIEIRTGLHTGEIEIRGDDIGGVAVHIGARVSACANAGEVLVSGAIPPLVIGSGIEFENRGEHTLKGVPGTWKLWAVDA